MWPSRYAFVTLRFFYFWTILSYYLLVSTSVVFSQVYYRYVGCYNDRPEPNRTFPIDLGRISTIHECYKRTQSRRYLAFGVENGDKCWSSDNATLIYNKHGHSNSCMNGMGGTLAIDVYILTGCMRPLGMQNGKITEKQLTAASVYENNFTAFGAQNARLHNTRGYRADPVARSSWLKVTFKEETIIVGIATQGFPDVSLNEWLVSYNVEYMDALNRSSLFLNNYGNAKIFRGNSDANLVVYQEVPRPMKVMSIKIFPLKWHRTSMALRFELFGCLADIDDCTNSPCQNNATCIDLVNRYQCNCTEGFSGINCQYNPCASNPCLNGGNCTEDIDKYSCRCAEGYGGLRCEQEVAYFFSMWLKLAYRRFNLELLDKKSQYYKLLDNAVNSEVTSFLADQPEFVAVDVRQFSPKGTVVAVEVSVKCLKNSTRSLMAIVSTKIKSSGLFDPFYMEIQDRANPSCSPPNSNLPFSSNATLAATFTKANLIEISTSIAIQCQSRKLVAYNAEFYSVCPIYGNVTRDSYVQLGMASTSVFKWRIPARQLKYGLYYVLFSTKMVGVKNTVSISYGFMRVTDTSLIAEIKGLHEVSQGENIKLELNGSGSYDPDTGTGIYDGMQFRWFCKANHEEFPEDIWTLPTVQPKVLNSLTSSSGGCYGTGIGRLISRRMVLQLDVDKMVGDQQFDILLVVTKGQRNATANHEVTVREEIHIKLRCRQNCGSSVIPSARLILETYCSGLLCDRISSYSWSIQHRNSSGDSPRWQDLLHLHEKSLTYSNSPNLVTKENIFLGNSSYRIYVTATTPKGFSSTTEYRFVTNAPPFGGICHVDEGEGEAWLTNFGFHCTGWIDYDLPLTYVFRYETSTNIEMVFKSGLDSHVKAKLPVGDPMNGYLLTVEIYISDFLGSSTKRSIQVKVFEPAAVSSQLDESVSHNGEMAEYLSKGNIELAAQQATTVLSVVNNAENSQMQLERKIKIKDSIIDEWSKVNATDLVELLQVSAVMAGVTEKRDEVSFKSQRKVVNILGSITEFFSKEVTNKSKAAREEEIQKAGTGLLQSMGNILVIAGQNARAPPLRRQTRDAENVMEAMSKESQNIAKQTLHLVNEVGDNLLVSKELYEKPTAFNTKSLSMVLDRQVPSKIGDKLIENAGMGIFLPPSNILFGGERTNGSSVSTQMLSLSENPFSWDESAKDVKSKVLDFELKGANGTKYNVSSLSQEVELIIPTKVKQPEVKTENFFVKPTFNGSMQYHRISIPGREYAVSIKLKPQKEEPVIVFVRYKLRPTLKEFNVSAMIPDFSSCNYTENIGYTNCTSDPYVLVLSHARTGNIGVHYIGVMYNRTNVTETINSTAAGQVKNKERVRRDCFTNHGRVKRSCVGVKDPPTTLPPTKLDVPHFNATTDINYTMSVSMSTCLYWNPNASRWTSDGCRVGPNSRSEALHCLCNHLSTFGGNFFVAPNPIDFDKVFAELIRIGETKNYVVLITVCAMFAIYILALVLARRSDRKDEYKAFQTLCLQSDGGHIYSVAVYTGMWRKCGTTANVAMTFYGQNGDSGVVQLSDRYSKKQLFARASFNNFIVSLSQDLGEITKIKIWHDNSGSNPSWFVRQIVIKHAQSNQKWYFICDRWLAVDKQDGEVQAEFDVADKRTLSAFKFLFRSRVAISLGDGHLWLSVATRPPQSPFTRAQRVSCCLAVLLSAMVASAMFYQFGKKQEDTFKLGPLRFSVRQIIIGIESALVVVPINLLIVTIFRKVKSSPSKKSSKYSITNHREKETKNTSSQNVKEPGCLPHFFVYIGWFLCLATAITAATFTILYSLQWGAEISNQWLTSVLISLIQDVCLMQPLKVILLSILFAWIIKKPLEEETQLLSRQTHLETNKYKKVEPLEGEDLLNARRFRQNVTDAAKAVGEIVLYVLFVFCLMVVTYGGLGNERYALTKAVNDIFSSSFRSIENIDSFWTWSKTILVPGLFETNWYNDQPFDHPEGFISNRQQFLVGMPRLRQLRVKSVDLCEPTLDQQNLKANFRRCILPYSPSTEYTSEYNMPGWISVYNTSVFHTTFDLERACPKPWRYRTKSELNILSYRGIKSTFDGGGYVADLGYNSPTALDVISKLEKFNWMDQQTAAVFVEFTVFEPASALFTIAKLLYEVPPLGKPLTKTHIDTLLLYSNPNQSFGSFLVACQITLLILLVYYLIRELRKIYEFSCSYFNNFWNWMDILQVISAVTTVVLFFFKEKYVSRFVQRIQANPFETSSVDYVIVWYQLEVYVLSVVVFIVTVKLLRLLRFNSHICQMSASLRTSSWHILSYSVIFFVLLISFACLGMLVFGNAVQAYSSFVEVFSALLQKFLGGNLHFKEFQNVNRIIGPIFVFSYMLCMGCVLINMFIAILNDSYESVKDLSGGTFPDDKLGRFMRNYYKNHLCNVHDVFKRKLGKLGYRHRLWDPKRREPEEFKDPILGSFVSLACNNSQYSSQNMMFSSQDCLVANAKATKIEAGSLGLKPELSTNSQIETIFECPTPAETDCSSSSCELLDLISELPESLVDDDDTMENVRQKLADVGAVLRLSKHSYRRFSTSGDKFVVERDIQIGTPVAIRFKGRRLSDNFQII